MIKTALEAALPEKSLHYIWVVTAALIGCVVVIFTTPAIGVATAAVLLIPTFVTLFELWRFDRLLLVSILVLSNVFILYKVIAVHRPNGDNLFSIRDLLLVALVLIGIQQGRQHLRESAAHRLVWPGLAIVGMLPFAAFVGLVFGGSVLIILQEVFTVSTWILALVVAANIRDLDSVRRFTNAYVAAAVVVAAGTLIESVSFGNVQIVSTHVQTIFSGGAIRNWPDGWVFMMVTWLLALAGLAVGVHIWRSLVLFGLMGAAFVVTQMRSMIIVFGFMFLLMVGVVLVRRQSFFRSYRLLVLAAVCAALGIGAFLAIRNTVGDKLMEMAVERYGNLGEDAAGRLYELDRIKAAMESYPLTGLGLGVRYRHNLPEDEGNTDTGTFVHNIVAFHLLKIGPIGGLLFLAFMVQVTWTFIRCSGRPYPPEFMYRSLGLSGGLLALVAEAQGGNVFGDIRQLPIAAITIGLFVANERLAEQTVAAAAQSQHEVS